MSFGGVRGFKSGVGRRGNAKEGVAVLMNERVRMCVRKIRLWIKRKFWTVIVVYAPRMERSEEGERDGFWEELKGRIEECEDRGKVVIMGDECQNG